MRLFAALTLVTAVLFWSHPFYAPHVAVSQKSWVKQAFAQSGTPVLVRAPAEPWAHRPEPTTDQPER